MKIPLPNHRLDESASAPIVSAAFWICLFAAAGLYAGVALAPKFRVYSQLQERHQSGQVELVRLERQVHYLQKVVDALQTEPEFAAELARLDFDAGRPGDERIKVAPWLRLDAREPADLPPLPPPASRWYEPWLDLLAMNGRVRGWLLIGAVVLVVGAFTFLQETQSPPAAAHALRRCFRTLADRYRVPPPGSSL